MDCDTEAALHLRSEKDQREAASANSHLPLAAADTIGMHEESRGYHEVPEKPGHQEANTNISAARNYIIVSIWA